MDNEGKSTICSYNCTSSNLIIVCERIMKLQPAKKINYENHYHFHFYLPTQYQEPVRP